MPGMEVFLFGKPRVERDGAVVTIARRKALALLAYLAVTRQAHSRDALVALLWPELDSEHGRAVLRSALADLGQAIGKEALAVAGDGVACQAPSLRVDVARFHDLLAQVAGHNDPRSRPCDDCVAALAEAVGLYRADFLAGFTLADAVEFDAWQTFQTESLRLELAAALEKLAQGLAGRGDHAAALAHARRWLALDPLHEPAQRLVMQLHAGAGDRAAAVRQYRECVKVLQEELGIEPEPETTALFAAIRGGTAAETSPAPPLAPSPVPAHNLPLAATPFIGRAAELAQVAAQLADPDCRLLTILGPGGIGKTRLAVQAARAAAGRFAHGACFVDLAPIASAELLAATILRTLQVPSHGAAEPDQHVLNYLTGKQMLLVLDNYEQLLTGTEPDRRDGYGLVTKILGAAPRIKLLVTSRTRLNVRAEWLAPLAGMRTPEEGRDPHHPQRSILSGTQQGGVKSKDAERLLHRDASLDSALQTTQGSAQDAPARELESYSATALFLACVRRVRPDFQPSADDARHIIHICCLLEGYPLAIELAAALARTLPLARIARELETDLSLLTTTLRDVPARHRSMVAAFDHSWRLLAPREQSLLRQLSIFRGGWTEEAAESVAGATLADLSNLTDASWLRPAPNGRYGMHELARQYCAAKLDAEHESATDERADQVRNRHATFFCSLLMARMSEFFRRPSVIPELSADRDNLLAAWNWAAATDDLDAVRAMIPGLQWFANLEGWERSLKSLLEKYAGKLKAAAATENLDTDRHFERDLVLATTLDAILADMLGFSQGSWQAWVDEAMSLLARGGASDERWAEIGWRLRFRVAFGHLCWRNCVESARLFETLLPELAEGRFTLWPYTEEARYFWQTKVCQWWGYDALHTGQYDEARRLAEQGLALAEQSGIPLFRLDGLILLASVLIATGDCRQAETHLREYLRISRAHGLKYLVAVAFYHLGLALVGQGAYVRARACAHRSLTWSRESGQLLGGSLQLLGRVELGLGNLAQAKRCYQHVISLNEESGASVALAGALTGLASVALAIGDLVAAREHLLRALAALRQSCVFEWMVGALTVMAELLQAEGQAEAAAELCATLLSWPATPFCVLETAQRVRPELETRLEKLAAQLPPAVFAAATARGRSRQVDEVVAEIVGS